MSPNVTWSRASSGVILHRKMPPSRKVLQAVLFTSLMWLCIDVVLLTTYSYSSESSGEDSIKLPTALANKRSRSNHDRIGGGNQFLRGNNLGIGIWNKMLGRIPDQNIVKPDAVQAVTRDNPDSFSSDSQRDHSDSRTKPLKRPLLEKLKRGNENKVLHQSYNQNNSASNIGKMVISKSTQEKTGTASIGRIKSRDGTRKRKHSKSIKNMTFHHVKNLDVTTMPRDPSAPGEGGKAVRTKPENRALVQRGWKHASFNEFVSDSISVERSIKDTRPLNCHHKMYADELPTTSIIICFTEESWSTLLRTVHSVLNRSPPELVEEVLLVDDFSQREYLKEPLDKYMERFPKVRIIRLQRREGLIRARIRGADEARGDVLTFLDSHIECNVGWLEPLVHRIWDDRRNVVCPVIDGIDSDSFSYDGAASGIIGSFTWDMQFRWQGLSNEERRKHAIDNAAPLRLSKHAETTIHAPGLLDHFRYFCRTPAMAGGLFSIDKEYFYELGTYDPGFDIWGAENLELSFKVWMCGGQLEILPCSRVGHIFRKTQPYKFPDGNVKTFLRNTQRMTEVWLDDYKDIFYKMRPELKGKPFGNITDRLLLKKKLGCHNFKWYLDNVYPSLEVPDTKFQASGDVRNVKLGKCMDSMGSGPAGVFPCHGKGFNQNFGLTWKGFVQFEMLKCLSTIGSGGSRLAISPCGHGKTIRFSHSKGDAMVDTKSGKCLDVNDQTNQLTLRHCDGSSRQRWRWASYFNRDGKQI